MNEVTVPSLVSPKETVVGHGKSYLVREIVTGGVVFTLLMHLFHWTFVILKVPGVDKERDAILQTQSRQLERVQTPDTDMRRVTPQGAPTWNFS